MSSESSLSSKWTRPDDVSSMLKSKRSSKLTTNFPLTVHKTTKAETKKKATRSTPE